MLEQDFYDNIAQNVNELLAQMQASYKIMRDIEVETYRRLKDRGPKPDFAKYDGMTPNQKCVWCFKHNSEYRTYAIRYFALKALQEKLQGKRKAREWMDTLMGGTSL